MLISEKKYKYMEQKGMTQKEFSQCTGISQSTISDWRRKKTNPSADKILKICEVLNITPYELLSESWIKGDKNRKESMDYTIVLNKDEELLLRGFRNLKNKQKERLLGYLEALQESDN